MNFEYTEEQQQLADSLRRYLANEYGFDRRKAIIASPEGVSDTAWAAFAELGLTAITLPEADGGFGGGAVDAMVIMEEFGKGLVVEPFLPTVVCAGGFLKHAGTAAQKEEHIGAIVSGSAVFAFAYAEPKGRYDYADLETTAKKDGSGYVLNGHKAAVYAAPWATHLLVTARTGGSRRERAGVELFLVDAKAAGITMREYAMVDGFRGAEVYFENVSIPAEALLPGGIDLIERVVDEATVAICAEGTGIARKLLEGTVEYTKQRKQFGQPIGKFQALQHRMADMLVDAEQIASMSLMGTLKLSLPTEQRKAAVSQVKAKVARSIKAVGQNAVQTHGGIGFTWAVDCHLHYRRSRQLSLVAGAPRTWKDRLVSHLERRNAAA